MINVAQILQNKSAGLRTLRIRFSIVALIVNSHAAPRLRPARERSRN
jgi:hypothetical protein